MLTLSCELPLQHHHFIPFLESPETMLESKLNGLKEKLCSFAWKWWFNDRVVRGAV